MPMALRGPPLGRFIQAICGGVNVPPVLLGKAGASVNGPSASLRIATAGGPHEVPMLGPWSGPSLVINVKSRLRTGLAVNGRDFVVKGVYPNKNMVDREICSGNHWDATYFLRLYFSSVLP